MGSCRGTASITIAWEEPESTGGSKVDVYRVERDYAGHGFVHLRDTTLPVLTDSGVVSGQLHLYRVSARNFETPDFGPYSEYITVMI